jgi:hypothetical protein
MIRHGPVGFKGLDRLDRSFGDYETDSTGFISAISMAETGSTRWISDILMTWTDSTDFLTVFDRLFNTLYHVMGYVTGLVHIKLK